MTPVSIVKLVASASVIVAAGGTALVLGVAHMPREQTLAADAVTATTSAPQLASAVRSDAPTAADKTSPPHAATQGLAAIRANPAAAAAELAKPPEAAAEDPSSPSFDIARVEADGEAVIAGRAAPGATVDLLRGDQRLDRAVADSSGEFVMVSRLPAGSYELTLSARLPDGTVTSSKHGAAVTISDAGASARGAQSRAEYVPEPASQPRPSAVLRSAKPQENAALQPAHASSASSAADEDASSPAARHAISSKIVSHGDSLWRISRIIYGDGSRYALLYRANRERIRNPDLIYPGQTLVLPSKHN